MWIDPEGVAHTVAVPDPRDAFAPALLAVPGDFRLDALVATEDLLDTLDTGATGRTAPGR